MRVTRMTFSVRVPVLSVQMTEVQPSVSTEASRRTRLCARAIRRTPTARAIVVTAGSPSGIAAMARIPPVSSIIQIERPRRIPSKATAEERAIATAASRRPSCSARPSRGVGSLCCAETSSPMRDSSVSPGAAVTISLPEPLKTVVPA